MLVTTIKFLLSRRKLNRCRSAQGNSRDGTVARLPFNSQAVLEGEDAAERNALDDELVKEYAPQSRTQREMLGYIAELLWRGRLADSLEAIIVETLRQRDANSVNQEDERERLRALSELAAKYLPSRSTGRKCNQTERDESGELVRTATTSICGRSDPVPKPTRRCSRQVNPAQAFTQKATGCFGSYPCCRAQRSSYKQVLSIQLSLKARMTWSRRGLSIYESMVRLFV